MYGWLVAGCVAGPNFVAPPVPSGNSYDAPAAQIDPYGPVTEAASAAPAQWWMLLQCPKLNDTMALALRNNHELAAAEATLSEVQGLTEVADAARFPEVDLSGGSGRQKYGAEFLGSQKVAPFSYFSLGTSIRYTLDLAGGIRRNVERQRALAQVEQARTDNAYLTISGNVALQALAIAATRAQIHAVETLTADDRQNVDLVRMALEAGSVSDLDQLNAQSQLDVDLALMPPLHRQLAVARHALAVLVGQSPADWRPTEFELEDFHLPDKLPLTLPSTLVRERPDIRAASAQLHAATAAVGIAAANLYPHLDLSADGSFQSLVLGNLFQANSAAGGLAANLSAPLINHKALRAKRRAALSAAVAALHTYEQTVLDSFEQVADLLNALREDGPLLAAQEQAVATSGSTVALTRQGYAAGYANILQVLDAERMQQRAVLGLVQARIGHDQNAIYLLLALGGEVPRDPSTLQ